LFLPLLFRALLAFLTRLLLLLLALFLALLPTLACLLPFLLSLLLALFAFRLVLLATLFAATASALGTGEATRAQQCRRHQRRHCRSFPILSVHPQRVPFAVSRGESCAAHIGKRYSSRPKLETPTITHI
jgi:hypothetical protein